MGLRRGGLRRVLLRAVLWVVANPGVTLLASVAVLAGCIVAARLGLEVSTDQNKQFSDRNPVFRQYLEFIDKFPENEAAYVLVEARGQEKPPVRRWVQAAEAIATRLRGLDKHVRLMEHRVSPREMGVQGLAFDSRERVEAALADVKRFIPLAKMWGEEQNPASALLGQSPAERFLAALMLAPADAETAGFVALLARSWNLALQQPEAPLQVGSTLPDLAELDASDPSRLGYFYVPDKRDASRSVLLVRVYPHRDFASKTALSESVAAVRAEVAAAMREFPEFSAGVTGRPAMEADELHTTDRDARIAETLAMIAIFVGLIALLRSVWLALVTMIGLGFGIGWTFGWATATVGELNLLSMVFLLALIGIGIDYLIQVVSRYQHEAAKHGDSRRLWVAVFRHIAAPINTTCAGAAGAFAVSVLTDFRGASELGIIAGGGLFLCLLAGYTVVPSVLTISQRWRARRGAAPAEPVAPRPNATRASSRGAVVGGSKWAPPWWLGPAVWCTVLLIGLPFALRSRFDPGLINLQAANLESVQLVDRLETWSAAVLSKDLDVLRRCRDALSGSAVVDRTESVLDAIDNQRLLQERSKSLPAVRWAQPPELTEQAVTAIAKRAAALAQRYAAAAEQATGPDREALDAAAAALKARPLVAADAARFGAWQAGFVGVLRDSLAQFSPPPVDASAIPAELRTHLVSADGTYALYVYPKADLWIQSNLAAFMNEVDARLAAVPGAPRATGIAPEVFHVTGAVRDAFFASTGLALGLIFLLVIVDFRRLRPTLLAFSVIALGLPMLVAVMGLMGVSWNFANFFGLPILIGAGHEYGVFLVHRHLEAVAHPRRVWRAWDVSDRALCLCAFATCSAFGFFWAVSHHQGLKSLGLVMALGVGCIYLAAVVVLRPILRRMRHG